MDFHNMIGKLRAIESLGDKPEYVAEDAPESAIAGKCNMTAEGKSCPVHGMEECWSTPMEEGDVDTLKGMLKNSGQMNEAGGIGGGISGGKFGATPPTAQDSGETWAAWFNRIYGGGQTVATGGEIQGADTSGGVSGNPMGDFTGDPNSTPTSVKPVVEPTVAAKPTAPVGSGMPAAKPVTRASTGLAVGGVRPAASAAGMPAASTDTSGGVTSNPTYVPKTNTPTPVAPQPSASASPAPATFKDAFRAARKEAGGAGGVFMWKGKPYQTNVKGETAKAWNSPDLKKVGSGWPTSESTKRKMKSAIVAEAKITENFLVNLVGDIRNAFKPGIAITPALVKELESAAANAQAGKAPTPREQKILDTLMSTTLARELNKFLKKAPKDWNVPTLESAGRKKKYSKISEAGGVYGGGPSEYYGGQSALGNALAKLRSGDVGDARELKYKIMALSNDELDKAAKTWGKSWPEIAKELARRNDLMKLPGVSDDIEKLKRTPIDKWSADQLSSVTTKLPPADAANVAKLIKLPSIMPLIKKVLWRAIPGLGAYLQGKDAIKQALSGNWRNAFIDLGIAGINIAQVFGYAAGGAPGVAALIADISGNLYVNRATILKLYYSDVLGIDLGNYTTADLEAVADSLIYEIAKQLATQISDGISGALNNKGTDKNVNDTDDMVESVDRMRELAGLNEMVDDSDDQAKVDDMAADMSADAVDEMVTHDHGHEDDMSADMTIEDLMRKYGVDDEDEVNEDAPLVGMPFTSLGATNNGPEEWGMVVTGGTNTNNFNESKQLKEGFTISSNMDVRDGKVNKSLTINATDDDVDTLATMLRNAGMGSHVSINNHSDVCDNCGNSADHCTCGMNQTAMCSACNRPIDDCECDMESDDCGCGSENCTCGMTMENADHDYGHDEKSEIGEPLDVEEYVWDGPHLNQRFGKIGDNTLMAERAITLFKNYSDQYTQMLEEADLDPSNAGFDSPLTANSRDEFDKDPFVDETPVDDGSRSPLSTVKRQDVMN